MLNVEPAMRSGAQAVLDHLVAEGVSIAFGYPGGAIMPLYDALFHERRIDHVLTRHEAGAAFAAGAYGRTTGNVGVCIATSGPGATNLITGLLDAYMDSVPLIAITGQVRSPLMGTDGFQEADVAAIASSCVKRAFVVRSIEELVPTLHRAFKIARGPRPGPVLVDIPTDVLRAQMKTPVAEFDFTWPRTPQPPEEPQVDAGAIERAIAILRNARRPLVIVGGGARISGAVDEFREFVYRAGVPHAATINGLGCATPGDPTFLGMLGMHGWKAANRAVMTADAIFALGMRFDDRVTGRTDRFATGARIVHADIDASEFDKIIPVELALHGDLRATLRALNKAVARTNIPVFARWCDEASALGGALPRDRAKDGHLSATDVLDRVLRDRPVRRRRRDRRRPAPDVGRAARAPDAPAALPHLGRAGLDGLRPTGRDRREVRASRQAGRRDRRRRRVPDVDGRARDAAPPRPAGQSAADRQPQPRHGAAVAAVVLRRALLGDEPARQSRLLHDRAGVRRAGRDGRLRSRAARGPRTFLRGRRPGAAARGLLPRRKLLADDPPRRSRRRDGRTGARIAMIENVQMRDPRMVARIVNLALRCNCGYREMSVVERDGMYEARFSFTGDSESLRRLKGQLDRAVADDASC